MACNLNDKAVEKLYGYLHGEITDRIAGKNKDPFDIKGAMKQLYTALNNAPVFGFESEEDKKEKALYFAQAVPQVLAIVVARPEIRDYFLKADPQIFIQIPTLASEYSDISKIEILVKPKIRTRKTVKKEIEQNLDEQPTNNPDETKKYSYAEYSAKVVFPNGTTGQAAFRVDPGSNQDKNKKDPEKQMFYDVIKDIVYIARQRKNDTDEILYGEENPVSLALTLVSRKSADKSMFTEKDLKFQKDNPDVTTVIAVVTDTNGNPVYFNEDGSINFEGGGRRVYQWVRTPLVENGKLFFSGAYGKKTSLVTAEEYVETWVNQKRRQKIYPSDEEIAKKVIATRNEQTKLFNDLLRLNEVINATNQPVTLKITAGSFGMVNETMNFIPVAETGLKIEDLKFQKITTDPYKGRFGATIRRTKPGITVEQLLLLQRPNISNELAEHIADILTTKAKLLGKELTPNQRRVFFENFINNKPEEGFNTSPDKILVKENGLG